MKETNTILALVAAFVISACLNVYLAFMRPADVVEHTKTEYITQRDTVIDVRHTTDTVWADKIKWRDRYVYDTIHKDNVVYVRDTAVVHHDSTRNYTIDVSAVRLNWYKLDIHTRDTVTLTEVNTVERIAKPKRHIIEFGVYGGMGYDPHSKSFGPSVGLGIMLPLGGW